MKAILPKSYKNLPKSEKKIIDNLVMDWVDKEEAELQEIYLMLCCKLLHESFGFGEERCSMFVGNWWRIYDWNKKTGSKKEQKEALRNEMDKIFRLSAGREQRLVLLRLIDILQRHRIIDGGDMVQLPQLCSVYERKRDQRHSGDQRAYQNKRRAASPFAVVLIGNGSEKRQQEKRQDIVRRHNNTGPALRHTEFVGQDQRDDVVIRLPEGADQEKGKAHKDRSLVIQFHSLSSSSR